LFLTITKEDGIYMIGVSSAAQFRRILELVG
jgi:hypothetical protein